jgi:hypothetical protein
VVQGATNEIEQTYEVSWRITNLDPGRTRAVDVRVEWDEPKHPNRVYALSSIRFNHEGL